MNSPDEVDQRDPAVQNAKRELTVQVYVRPELLLEPVDAKIETLRTLEAEGVVDGLVLHYWPAKVELSSDPPHSEAIDAFERFRTWADAHEVEISPPFSVRTRSSEITGEQRTVLSTPVVCVAVYRSGRLVGVYPHSDGDLTRSVGEAIAALRTGQFPTDRFEPSALEVDVADETPPDRATDETPPDRATDETPPDRATDETPPDRTTDESSTGSGQCSGPDCDGTLANVQGVLVCPECQRPTTSVPDPDRRVLAGHVP